MASVLHTLPPCLIVELCDFLDVSSLGRLRLVSKSFKALLDVPFLRCCRRLHIDLSRFGLRMLRRLAMVESGMRDLTLTCVLYEFPYPYHQGHHRDFQFGNHLTLPRWKARAEAEEQRRRPVDFSIEADKRWMEERRSEQQEFSGEDMCAMLTRALGELRSLKTITLTAHIVGQDRRNYRLPEDVREFHWRELWAHAIQAYRVVMSAIARSGVNIEGLHIYRGVKLCGVPTNEASMPLEKLEGEGFAIVARRLKSFSIRLASVVDPIRLRDGAADTEFYDRFDISRGRRLDVNDRQLVDRESDPEGVARLLRLMPNLESLDLHFFTRIRETDELASYKAFLTTVMRDLRFPHLRDLGLAGFWATEESAQRIIRDHPALRALSLRHFRLTDGSWEPIFAVLRQATSLTHLYLSDLHSPGVYMLLQFKTAYMNLEPSHTAGAHDHLPGLDGDPMWELRAIRREELRRGLQFSPMPRGGMASRELWAWIVYRSVDFGPLPSAV